MSEDGSDGWKFVSIILITVLITACFVGWYVYNAPDDVGVFAASKPSFIDISILGPDKLSVNEAGNFEAIINSEASDDLEFTWSISPQDNKTVLVSNGEFCDLTFVEATEELYLLSVQVHDLKRGNFGSAAYTVYDPYTNPNLYLESTGDSYSFKVETDGLGWYRAINGLTGAVAFPPSTDAASIINQAFNGLTSGRNYPEKVLLFGDITINSPLLVPNHVIIELVGTVTLASNSNCYMLQTTSSAPFDITIFGGVWDGNSGVQSSGGGFNITGTSSAEMFYNNRVWIHDTHVYHTYASALKITLSGGCRTMVNLDSCRFAAYNTESGITVTSMTDFIWSNLDVAGSQLAISLTGCMSGSITGFRTDGGLWFAGCQQLAVTSFFVDTYDRDVSGISLYNCHNMQVTSGMIRADSNSGYTSKYGLRVLDDATHNQISNVYIGRPEGNTMTQLFAYGVYEDNSWGETPDYNLYSNIDAHDTTNGNLLRGSHSVMVSSYNSTGIAK